MDNLKCKVCGENLKVTGKESYVTCTNCEEVNSFYNVFVSCKNDSGTGQVTIEARVAKEIYDELVSKGYKVFYVSMENGNEKLLSSALKEAKIMIVIGTNTKNFNDAKVKSEWQQYLAYMKEDASKQIIPCYRDMMYDLPDELQKFESIDISGAWFVEELVKRVLEKLDVNKTVITSEKVNKKVKDLGDESEVVISKVTSEDKKSSTFNSKLIYKIITYIILAIILAIYRSMN